MEVPDTVTPPTRRSASFHSWGQSVINGRPEADTSRLAPFAKRDVTVTYSTHLDEPDTVPVCKPFVRPQRSVGPWPNYGETTGRGSNPPTMGEGYREEIGDTTTSRSDSDSDRLDRDVRAGWLPEQHRREAGLRAEQLLGSRLIL